ANGMAVAGYFPLGMVLLAWGVHRTSAEGFGALLRQLFELYAVAALCFVPISRILPSEALAWRAGLSVLAGLFCLVWAWWRFGRAFLVFLRGDL
ncbi:MAG: hypothetical protein AAF725_26210, partial [Acidobacteriota bacterium]